MGLEKITIKSDFEDKNKMKVSKDGDDYLFNPVLHSLENEIGKQKQDKEKIFDVMVKLRNTLVQNLELIDIPYEAIDEEFKKYYRDFNSVKFQELSSFIESITKNAVEKENILRKEEQERMEKRGGVVLNDLMVYDLGFPRFAPEVIAIHISPNKTISSGKKLVLLRDALRKLAEVVNNTPTVKSIQGESWIIRDYPDLIKKMGFSVDSQMLKRLREFFNRTPSYLKANGIAKISREDFLERYYKK